MEVIRAETGKPAVARVVLVDPEGAQVAAVDSGRDGSFQFTNIAAGSYRITVAGRSDFPGDGMPVTLDRDSVTGLELRGTGGAPGRGRGAKAAGGTPGGNRRPWAIAAVIAGMMGACGLAFFYLRSDDGKPAMSRLSGMWNSATGPGIASGGASPGKEDPDLNSGARSLLLEKEPAYANTTVSAYGKRPKEIGAHGARAPLPGKEPLSDAVADGEAGAEGDRKQPIEPQARDPREDIPGAALSANQGNPDIAEEKSVARDLGGNASQGTPDTKGAIAQPVSSKESPAPSTPPQSGTPTPPEAEHALPLAAHGFAGKKMLVIVASPSGQAVENGAATAPYSTGGGLESTVQGADAGGDGARTLGPSAAGGSSNGQPAGSRAGEAGEPAGGAPAGAVSPDAADSSVAARVQAEVGDSSKTASAVAKPPPMAPPKNPNRAESPPLLPDVQQSSAGKPASSAAADAKATGEPVVSNPVEDSAKATPRKGATASIAAEALPSGEPDPAEVGSHPPLGDRSDGSATAAASSREPRNSPSGADQGNTQARDAGAGIQGAAQRTPPSAKGAGVLVRISRARASNWSPQVFEDTILPTRPEPMSAGEVVETMRADLKKEKLSRLPDSLRHPLERRGFAIEYPAGREAPEWRNVDGNSVGAEVRGNRAELTFLAGHSPPSRLIVLAYKDGREIAQVTVGPDGTPVLKAAPGTRSWYWVGLVHPRAEGAFTWKVSSGGSAAAEWQIDDQWSGGPGQRIEIPITAAADRSSSLSISLIDPSTGCGVTCAVVVD